MFCQSCTVTIVEAVCPVCHGPASTWPFLLTDADQVFLRVNRIAVDDPPAAAAPGAPAAEA
jgi:hypothetical protein